MCTVTIIPLSQQRGPAGGAGFRLACNRDEQRTRPAALPPARRAFGGRAAVLPTDPAGGGTWVAANDAGLVLCLLNRTVGSTPGAASEDAAVGPRRSRGLIIPAVLDCVSSDDVARRLLRLDAARYGPFRLVAIDGSACVELRSDGRGVDAVRHAVPGRPLLFTSSGLGDALVEAPRRALFDAMLRGGGGDDALPAAQAAFHRHQWPDRPHLGVCMARPDARAVSHTVVDVGPGGIEMRYHPAPPDEPAPTSAVSLPIAARGAVLAQSASRDIAPHRREGRGPEGAGGAVGRFISRPDDRTEVVRTP